MSMRVLVLVLGAVLCATPGFGGEASGDPSRSITVNGNAEVRVVPDEVVLTVGVESLAPDIAAAKADNDRRVTAMTEVARSLGVSRERIATEYLGIEPLYEDGYAHTDFRGYLARKTVVITLRNIDRFEELLSSLLAAGVNYVHGIDFRTTELRRHRDEARALALKAAREKAEAMATELGEAVGRPLSIQEGYGGWWSSYGSWWGQSMRGPMSQNVVQNAGPGPQDMEGPTLPGQISVTASVTVTFELGD